MQISDYYSLAEKTLSEYRFHHSKMVAKAARELAEKYSADINKAEIAGILHDITKEEPKNNQLQLIEDNGIMLDSVTNSNEQILHAVSGSAYCEFILGIKDREILDAIRFHTTARADMSLLEKIVFIADFISEDRTYPDIEIMRQEAQKSLEHGMKYALTFVIKSLVERGRCVHPDAIDAYNEIIMKGI